MTTPDPLPQATRAGTPPPPRRHTWPMLVLAWLLLPLVSAAQVENTDDYLARLDTNQDGRIAVDEYQAWMGYAFERMDANGDGTLTDGELPATTGKTISLAEHRETLAGMFQRLDVDGDGFLDAAELAAPPR